MTSDPAPSRPVTASPPDSDDLAASRAGFPKGHDWPRLYDLAEHYKGELGYRGDLARGFLAVSGYATGLILRLDSQASELSAARAERGRLREIAVAGVNALPGCAASSQVSVEFLSHLPEEIRLAVAKLTRERDAALSELSSLRADLSRSREDAERLREAGRSVLRAAEEGVIVASSGDYIESRGARAAMSDLRRAISPASPSS